ncbi:MAG: hypothetical protein NTW80_11295, partial [Deltaproteobacteria bacterium]|nr:hypothetical protein [Deltaproteobacteria bacterium]
MNRYVAKWLKIVIINVAIFCSFLTIIEITVRIVFTEIIPFGNSNNLFQDKRFGNSVGLTPNIKGYSFGAEVVTNGLGFRIDPASPDPRGKHHILVLGDSISFGPGIKAGDTFPFILQKRLKDCQIINASVPGYSTGDYFNVLSFEINSKLSFEGVIISICLNDFSDASQALIKQQLEKNRDIIYHNAFLQLLKYVSD